METHMTGTTAIMGLVRFGARLWIPPHTHAEAHEKHRYSLRLCSVCSLACLRATFFQPKGMN